MKWVFAMLVVVLVLGFFAYRGCASDAEKTVAFAKTLLAKNDEFEKARKESVQSIVETKGEFEELAKASTTAENAAKRFEARWKTVHKRHDELKLRFVALGGAIDAYFSELERRTSAINDARTRDGQHRKNEAVRTTARAMFSDAENSMARLGEAMKKGDDLNNVLALEAARDAIRSKLDEVRAVLDDAKHMCDELEVLTQQSRMIAEGTGPSSRAEPPLTGSAEAVVTTVSSGADARHPLLAPEDGDGDSPSGEKRSGADGWGDRCYRHIMGTCSSHPGKQLLGYAKAECERAMSMNPSTPDPRGSVLFNLGLIEQEAGDHARARRYFQDSLSVRKDARVSAALTALNAP